MDCPSHIGFALLKHFFKALLLLAIFFFVFGRFVLFVFTGVVIFLPFAIAYLTVSLGRYGGHSKLFLFFSKNLPP